MENQFEEPKKYRVIRKYENRDKGIEYFLYMNLSNKLKRITAVIRKNITEGVNNSEFVSVVENTTTGKCVVELWKGTKDDVVGHMHSKRVFEKSVNMDIAHLFVSETTTNCFAIKNNTEAVAQVAERVFEFANREYKKSQHPL